MKRTPAQLLRWLFAARRHDPTSYTVELYVGELDVKIVTVPFPFRSGGEVAPGTGKYKVSLSV
jgi:hypothetical protein